MAPSRLDLALDGLVLAGGDLEDAIPLVLLVALAQRFLDGLAVDQGGPHLGALGVDDLEGHGAACSDPEPQCQPEDPPPGCTARYPRAAPSRVEVVADPVYNSMRSLEMTASVLVVDDRLRSAAALVAWLNAGGAEAVVSSTWAEASDT